MAKRTIRWTRSADIQYYEILEYWVKRNKSVTYSKKLMRIVARRTKQIADMPSLYRKTNFKDVRVSSLGNYSIYYKVSEKEIIIVAFWDNHQDPNALLQLLASKK